MAKVFRWSGNQLTYYQEYQNIIEKLLWDAASYFHASFLSRGITPLSVEDLAKGAGEVDLLLIGDGIVGFTIGSPWYTTDRYIVEEYVYNVPDLQQVVDGLTAIALTQQAKRITLGTASVKNGRHMGLAKMYERAGCKIGAIELIKETT